jgi:tetratricopeptide (TPR) repeat protein
MRIAASTAWLVSLALLLGCDSPTTTPTAPVRPPQFDSLATAQQDDFSMGMELLDRRPQLLPPDIQRQEQQLTLYHLNQWLVREGREHADWKPAQLSQRIPQSLAAIQPMQELDRLRLTRDDLDFLRGRVWQREVVRYLERRPQEAWMEAALASSSAELDQAGERQLAIALQSFDWTIRNIQLEPFANPQSAALPGVPLGDDTNAPPPQRGVPGPGYLRYPYETMLYGRGDAFERSRVFIELCRQAGIEAFVLAVRPEMGTLKPWAVAVMISQHLFLFDAELGLPLPGAGGEGIVTLADLVAQPELLDQLHLDDRRTYWVQPADLLSLEVLLSASPEELSKRMELLAARSTGPRRLAVYVDVDRLAERIRGTPPLEGAIVSLWRVPFDCYLYSIGRGLRLSRDPEFAIQYERESRMLRNPSLLGMARMLQLQAEFTASERSQGATALMLESRPPERDIEALLHSPELQQAAGLSNQLSRDPQERERQLETFASFVQRMRYDSTYWLGLIQYERRDYKTALDWLKTRTLDDSEANPWRNGARYNSARCYEALGQRDDAIRLLRQSTSPQRHGDLLRAKRLAAGE